MSDWDCLRVGLAVGASPRQDEHMSARVNSHASGEGEDIFVLVKTLGDPVNVEIVRFLSAAEGVPFGDIMASTNVARATLAKHLRMLQDIDVVVGDRPSGEAGSHARYSLNRARVESISRRHLGYMLGEKASGPD